mgnify:CR=1 FL=1
MDYRQEYDKWCNDPYFDEQTREELKAIAGDDKEIEDRFYRTLEFGTAGLRGVIGAGTNRTRFVRQHRDWQIIFWRREDRKKVWQLHTIPV